MFCSAPFLWSAEIADHLAIEITMTIYAHAPMEEKRKALGKLGTP